MKVEIDRARPVQIEEARAHDGGVDRCLLRLDDEFGEPAVLAVDEDVEVDLVVVQARQVAVGERLVEHLAQDLSV